MTALLDPIALAWGSWAGLVIGVIGLFVSVIGLRLTFREARRAKDAARAAEAAVANVITLSRTRTRLSALSHAVSLADSIRERIESDGLKGNRELFTGFRRGVIEAIATMTLLSAASKQQDREAVEDALERIATMIDADIDQKVKIANMRDALHPVVTFLINQEALAKTEDFT